MKRPLSFSIYLLSFFLLFTIDLQAQVNLNKGLIFWLPINGNAKDASGNGKDGTVSSGTLTTDRFGVANSAYSFSGAVGITVNSITNGGNSANTISFWLKTTSTTNAVRVYGGITGGMYLNLYTTGHYLVAFDNTGNGKSSSDESASAVNTGKWVNITAKYSGGTTYAYVNGKLETTYSSTYFTGSTTYAVFPDYNTYYSAGYYGDMDDIRAYSRALSDSEVKAIYELPHAAYSANNECFGDSIHFADSSITASGSDYLWKFGDNSTSAKQNPAHMYSKPGVYDVTLIVTSPYKSVDSVTESITVYPLPTARFKETINAYKKTVSFIPDDTTYSTYSWNFGDNSSSTQKKPAHVYSSYGSYLVTLKVITATGCDSTYTTMITIGQKPIAGISIKNGCALKNIVFMDSSSEPDSCSYLWSFGDSTFSILKNPVHVYAVSGNYKINFKITSPLGLMDSVTKTIVVYPFADASFTYAISNYKVSFVPTDNSLASYFWDFGDSSQSPAKTPVHTYSSAGTYTVSLTAKNTNGCDSTTKKAITIEEIPVASFTSSNVCFGDSSRFIFDGTTSASSTYYWNFGDKSYSNQKNAAHLYTSAGNYIVSLKILNAGGNSDSTTRYIVVLPLPGSSFTFNVNKYAISFSPSDTSAGSFSWDFGDQNSSTIGAPVHTYTNSGNYQVTLTTKNNYGCTSSTTKTVIVNEIPVASFSAANFCEGDTVIFTDMSSAPPSSTYSWNFGDGYFSGQENPEHAFKGNGKFKVTLKVTNAGGQSDTVSKSITILAAPSARFRASINKFTVTFTPWDASLAGYTWDFGDNNSSSIVKPEHTYSNTGSFSVSLTTKNSSGCDSTLTLPLTIDGTTGIEEISSRDHSIFAVYPNPVEKGILHIRFQTPGTNCILQFINSTGQILFSGPGFKAEAGNDKDVDLSAYPAGVYYLRLISQAETSVCKIVIR